MQFKSRCLECPACGRVITPIKSIVSPFECPRCEEWIGIPQSYPTYIAVTGTLLGIFCALLFLFKYSKDSLLDLLLSFAIGLLVPSFYGYVCAMLINCFPPRLVLR